MVVVRDLQRDGAAQRAAETHAREHLYLVVLDFHATAAPVAGLSPAEVAVDGRLVEFQAGWQPFQYRRETGAMGLACRHKSKHCHISYLSPPSMVTSGQH